MALLIELQVLAIRRLKEVAGVEVPEISQLDILWATAKALRYHRALEKLSSAFERPPGLLLERLVEGIEWIADVERDIVAEANAQLDLYRAS